MAANKDVDGRNKSGHDGLWLVTRAGSGYPQLILLAKFRVIAQDFARELLDHLLPVGVFHAAGHLGHDLGNSSDGLAGVDCARLVLGHRIVRKEIVDGFDNQTVQARPFLIVFLVVGNGGSPR
jgi:hypothetical protein